jgi:hypothetical protein
MRQTLALCEAEALRRASLIDEATLEWWTSQDFPSRALVPPNTAPTWATRPSELNAVSRDLVTVSNRDSAKSFIPAFARVKLARPNSRLDQDPVLFPRSRPRVVGASQRRRAVG